MKFWNWGPTTIGTTWHVVKIVFKNPCTLVSMVLSVGNSLIHSLLICLFAQITQIKWETVSNLLRSLRTNEPLWANRSGCSCQKSDREQIAQVAHDKRATVRDSIRSLIINEQISKSLVFWANCSFALSLTKIKPFAQKNCQNRIFLDFLYVFCTF